MHAKTHARLIKTFYLAGLIGMLPLFIFWCVWVERWSSGSASIVPILILGATLLLVDLILWRLPVRCKVPGCNGRMKNAVTPVSDWPFLVKSKIEYRCTICDGVYEAYFIHLPSSDGIP